MACAILLLGQDSLISCYCTVMVGFKISHWGWGQGATRCFQGKFKKAPRQQIPDKTQASSPAPTGVWLSPCSVRLHIPFKSPPGTKCTLQLQQSRYPHCCWVSPVPLKCVTVRFRGKLTSLGSCWAPPSPSRFGRGHRGWAQLQEQTPAKCQRQGTERCCEVGAATGRLGVMFTSTKCISRRKTFTVT